MAMLPIERGGTGAFAKWQAFNNLSPSTALGDLIYFDGTKHQRLAVGADGTVLTADSGAAGGWSWSPLPATGISVYDDGVEEPGSPFTGINFISGSGIIAAVSTGIIDASTADVTFSLDAHTHAWSDITGEPTTLAGYGITDAQPLDTQLTSLAALSYAGNANKYVRINAAETDFEVVTLAGGGDMLGANNLSDVASAATAFGNIKQAATTGATGVSELCTDAEAQAMADTARVVTASNLAAIAALQADQETGTSTTRFLTPAVAQYHPSACKCWCRWTGNSTTILVSYNMTGIADTAVGDADGTIATDFSSANWVGQVSTQETGTDGWDADSIQSSGFNAAAAGTFGVLCGVMIDGGTAVGNLTDPAQWNFIGFGDQ